MSHTFIVAAALTLAAIVGKHLCAFAVVGHKIDRLSVGIGMIPRGEVGLIFATIGLTLAVGHPVVDANVFSAIVVMVITTVITPPALTWSFARSSRRVSIANRKADTLSDR